MQASRPGQWQKFVDEHYTELKLRLESGTQGFLNINRDELKHCIKYVGKRDEFDTAQVWLNALEWDGVPRIGKFLHQYLGTKGSEYTRAVSKYVWTALAGRILKPGVKADMVPVLVGAQGRRKSTAIAALVPDLEGQFCEINFHESDENIARKLRGVLTVEIAELQGLGTKEEESIKAFLTRSQEKWVPKYQEFATEYPRRCVFFGTTNNQHFLADTTRNRRWLPFEIGQIDIEKIKQDRDLLWAEGAHVFKSGGVSFKDAEKLAVEEHQKFMVSHPWQDHIASWLASPSSDFEDLESDELKVNADRDFIPTSEILEKALNLKAQSHSSNGRTLSKIMKCLGYEDTRSHLNGVQVRGWKKLV